MRKLELIALAAATVVFATPAAAQGRGRGNGGVPPGQRPPAGMCRIWIDGTPPGQQPAPTSCALAEARRPLNSRVIYGDVTPRSGRGRHENVSNGRIVNIHGRRCTEQVDVFGTATYDCRNDVQTQTNGNGGVPAIFRGPNGQRVNSRGQVIDSRGRVIDRSNGDEDGDEGMNGGRGDYGKPKHEKKHGHGHGHGPGHGDEG